MWNFYHVIAGTCMHDELRGGRMRTEIYSFGGACLGVYLRLR